MKYSRRQFLGTAAAGMGAMLLNGCVTAPRYFDPYEIVELGKTGIKTTLLSMGTGIRGGSVLRSLGDEQAVKLIREMYERGVRFFDTAASYDTHRHLGEALSIYPRKDYRSLGDEQAVKLIREMYERGVRFFDTAASYDTHRHLGEALSIYPRKDYVIFTKLTPPRRRPDVEPVPVDAEAEVKRYLEVLKTDYIDGLLLHGWGFSGNWNTEHSDLMTAFAKLKERGIIRAHGISSHSLDAVKTAVNEPWVETILVRINAFGVNMDDTPENVEPVVKQLKQAGKGIYAMKVYGEGAFADDDEKKDKSLSFVLGLGAVDALTIGMDKISDIVDNENRIRKVAKNKI